MTKEEVLKKVCCYHQEDKLEYTDDITIGEAMDAMTIWSNQQTADKDKRIKELEEELIKQKTFKINLQKMVEERDDLLIKHGIKKPAIRIDLSRND